MSTETVNQVVERLVQVAPQTVETFTAALGVPLQPGESNPFWRTYTFTLPGGPFAGGELRLNYAGDGALLSLLPRDPALGQADVDRAALGQRLYMRPNPRIPPEGVETEYFQNGRAQVATQWMSTSRRLRSLVLKWAPAAAPESAATAEANGSV